MISRRKIFWILALILLLGGALLIFRPGRAARTGVLVSTPLFGYRTNAGRAQPLISFLVSNTEPAAVRFYIAWLECRSPSGPSYVSRKLVPFGAAARSILLRSKEATNVVIALEDEQRDAAEPLFCCQISWLEHERGVQNIARPLDSAMRWLGDNLGFSWSPPWSRIYPAHGDAFASNLGVAEYFSRTWGFTRDGLLEERLRQQKLQAQRQRDWARIQAALPSNEVLAIFSGGTKQLTEQQRAELEAKAAFEQFCRVSTNKP